MSQRVSVPGVGDLEFPDGMSQADMAAAIQKNFPEIHSKPESTLARYGRYASEVAGPLDAAANIGSSFLSGPVAGLAGLGAAATKAAGLTNAAPADVVRSVADAATFRPRTKTGAAIAGAVTYPFRKLAELGDYAGGKAADAGYPALGAGVNTAIQFAPAVLSKFRARGAAPQLPGAVPPELVAAQDFVKQRTSLDWNALSDNVRQQLASIAKDSETLGQLDPVAVERQARLESLPAPITATRGQITRDTAQLTQEGTLAATEAGRPLKAIRDAQSGAIIENLNILKGRVGGTAQTPEQVGLSVQDAALRTKLKLAQQNVSNLYKMAEQSGELQGPASTMPLRQLLIESPDLTHLGWVESWLNKIRGSKESRAMSGDVGSATPNRNSATLKELEDLRQAAVAKAMDGGTEGYYAGKVIRAIDQATEGSGGHAYQAARAARRAQALEFEDQGAVARLVENKSRTDRAVALEDTWRQAVLGGSIDDLRKVQRSLLTGGNAATKVAGRRAWRDIRAQTIQYITDQATKGAAPLPDGTTPVSAASMQRAINAVGLEKLETIFGSGTVRRIGELLKATQDVRTEPPRIHPNSSTAGNIVAFLEKSLGKLPILGDTVSGTIRGVGKLRELGQTSRELQSAQTLPLDESAATAQSALRGILNRNALSRAAPALGPTQRERR